jgi:release factor glutamine methyltransferase
MRWEETRVDGIDIDPVAVRLAAGNVELNGIDATRCRILLADAASYSPDRRYDLIVANPPQIPVPPGDESVSGAGPDGAAVALATLDLASHALSPTGTLVLALADFVPLRRLELGTRDAGLQMEVYTEVVCRPGPFTLSYRRWIERDGYRFKEGPSGLEFWLRVLVFRRRR